MTEMKSNLSQRAFDLVSEAYEQEAAILNVDLDRINRMRPPSLRYDSIKDAYRQFVSDAGAVSTFAVNLGLLTSKQAKQIILEFQAAHPELARDDEDFDIPSR